MFIKYFERHLGQLSPRVSAVCTRLNLILNSMTRTFRMDELMRYMESLQSELNTIHFQSCLLTTKEYVNSLDFNFPGKYHSQKLFFGLMHYVSPSPFLESLNEKLDFLLRNSTRNVALSAHKSKQFRMLSRVNKIFSGMYQLLRHTQKMFPWVLFTTVQSTKVTASRVALSSFEDWHVCSNVPLTATRISCLTETHINTTMVAQNALFIHKRAKKNDIVLFEGRASLTPFPCNIDSRRILREDLICIGWEDMETYNKILPYIIRLEQAQNEMKQLAERNSAYTNEWEKIGLKRERCFNRYKESRDMVTFYLNRLQRKYYTYSQAMFVLRQMKDLQREFDYRGHHLSKLRDEASELQKEFAVISNTSSKLAAEEKNISSIINGEDFIKSRNKKGLIKTLRSLKRNPQYKNAHFYIFGGALHFFPAKKLNDKRTVSEDFCETEKTDPQDELARYLERESFATFYPK